MKIILDFLKFNYCFRSIALIKIVVLLVGNISRGTPGTLSKNLASGEINKMKKITLLLITLSTSFLTFGQVTQSLVGKWQAENAEVTSMYFDSYEFFNNGRFIFRPNEYDGLNPVLSIADNYNVK